MKKDDGTSTARPGGPSRETPPPPELDLLRARVKELEADRDRLRAEAAENRDRYLRARADYENLAKRASKEGQDSVRFAKSALLLRFAAFLESFESAAKDAERRLGEGAKGLRLVAEEAHRLLKDEGVKEISGLGQAFNVRFHLAVDRHETRDHPEGTIVEVVQRGYQYGEDILKPALVKVAVPPRPAPAPDAGPAKA